MLFCAAMTMNGPDPVLHMLHGRHTSLVLEQVPGQPPLWRHWGARLPDGVASGPGLIASRPVPTFSLDAPVPFSLFPGFGLGWYGQSALLAHRNGRDFAQGFATSNLAAEPGRLICTLDDEVAGIRVVVELALDAGTDVLTVRTRLTNRGSQPLAIQWLAAAVLPLPAGALAVRHHHGRHNREFAEAVDALGHGIWLRENRRGLTGHDGVPGAVVMMPGATEQAGTAYGAQLAWSGNSRQCIEWLDDGRYQWQLGEFLAPGEVVLAPGETLAAPDVLATCSLAGSGGVARNFHGAVRRRQAWPGGAMRPRPVLINTWEGFYFDHDPARLMALADAAAEVGIERFVLDDGWFAGRRDDRRALGDWWVDTGIYPDGLRPLADHVRRRGMEFGLWVEPEMVNPHSDLFRAYPEWALQLPGRPLATARNQLVLDLTRPAVADHLFERLSALVGDLGVAYLKWDHNRDLAPAGDAAARAAYRRQVLANWQLMDRLRAAHPQLEIESCAGGGGRIDAGMAARVQRFWASDCIDALLRIGLQRGFQQFLPPELMGAHIGAARCHTTGRVFTLGFQALVAMQGHLGVEQDITRMDSTERAKLAGWIGLYKQYRHLLHGGEVWRGTAGDGVAWHAAGNGLEWLLILYRTAVMEQRHTSPLPLPFLGTGRYDIAEIRPGETRPHQLYDGAWLAHAGLPIPPGHPNSATAWHIRRA